MITDESENRACVEALIPDCRAAGEEQGRLFEDWKAPEGPLVHRTPRMGQVKKNLSLPAEKLLRIIRSLSRLKGYCFASQKVLARYLGRSVRTVQVHLRELLDRGLLRIEREGRNHYFPLGDPHEDTAPATLRNAQFSAPEGAGFCASNAQVSAPSPAERPYEIYVRRDSSSKEDAAAAPLEEEPEGKAPSEDASEAIAVFQEVLGVQNAAVEKCCRDNPKLAAVAAPLARDRFASTRRAPPENPIGFVLEIFKNPRKYGIELIERKWVGPQTPPVKAVVSWTPRRSF